MSTWLLKTEPNDYSWSDLERDGETMWDGVKNNLALKHMREVRTGDRAFFYHTGKARLRRLIEVVDPGLDNREPGRILDLAADNRHLLVGIAQRHGHAQIHLAVGCIA